MTRPVLIESPAPRRLARLFAWLGSHERDCYFWLGLGAIWGGIAGYRSAWLALIVAGAALFLVAVFGIASTRPSPRTD